MSLIISKLVYSSKGRVFDPKYRH